MSLQTIEDFEKEVVNSSVYQEDMRLAALRSSSSLHQENPTVVIGELATGQESLTWPAFSSQPPRKQRRREVSLRELQTEQEALAQMGSTNWIGRLFEYRNVHPVDGLGITYTESSSDQAALMRFSSVVAITESTDQFGGISFSTKKNAKQYAAKKAIDWLIENDFMPADGSVSFPKSRGSRSWPQQQQQRDSQSSSRAGSDSAPSCVTQVPVLCYRLGFSPPKYVLHPVTPGAALYDAWADFGYDPRIEGRVGMVRSVFGKKTAKEEVAKIVISFLRDIERQRTEDFSYDSHDGEELYSAEPQVKRVKVEH